MRGDVSACSEVESKPEVVGISAVVSGWFASEAFAGGAAPVLLARDVKVGAIGLSELCCGFLRGLSWVSEAIV